MITFYLTLLIAAVEIIIGLIAVSKKPDSIIHKVLFSTSLFIGLWTLTIAVVVCPLVLTETVMRIFVNLMFLFGILITMTFILLASLFPDGKSKISICEIIVPSVFFILIFIILYFTNLFVVAVYPGESLLKQIKFNMLGYGIYALTFLSNLIYASILFVKKYLNLSGNYKQQILYFGLGLSLSIFLAAIFNIVFPLFGNVRYVKFTPFFAVVFISTIFYAILKYRLLDIELVIKRTTVYLVLVGFISGLYAFVVLVPYSLFGKPGSVSSIVVLVIATLIITLTIQPLRNWLGSLTDKIFFQKKYDYQKILSKVSRELSSAIRLEDAFNIVMEPIINEIHLKGVGIYLKAKAGDEMYSCHAMAGELAAVIPETAEEENPLVNYLSQIKKYVESGEFRYRYGHLYAEGEVKDKEKAAIQHEMDNTFHAGLFVPLMLKTSMIGFIVLGEKKSGDQFSYGDLALLETIANQLVTAMDNIRLYEQMLNNERLTIIGTMSASIAHEIRNPLASIKTFIQMLKDKYNKPEFIKKFNNVVPFEIERIARITTDLLNFSKPSSPCLELVHIPDLMDRVLALIAAQMRRRQIQVEKNIEEGITIQADSQQLFQVFLNILLNAMHASPNGTTISISTEIKDKKQGYVGPYGSLLYVHIQDQGTGIKRKDIPNIFQPFVTTKNEGTGLGLATCKRIMDAHRGYIDVDSELGQGTKMSVVLPMNLTRESIGQNASSVDSQIKAI